MKKGLECITSLMIVLGNLCVFLGCFFAFAKGYNWNYAEEKLGALFHIFECEGYSIAKTMLVIMWIIVYVSLIIFALRPLVSKDKAKVFTSIMLVLLSIVGKYCFGIILDEAFPMMYVDYMGVEKSIGYTMIEKAYTVLILGTFLDVILCIYSLYVEKLMKNKWDSAIILLGAFKCPKCGKIMSSNSKFCGGCGFSMDVFKCTKCGAKRDSKELFCKECGEPLPNISMYDEERNGR